MMPKFKKRISKKDRIRDIKRGFINPVTAQEWAIYYASLQKKNANKIASLHAHAAINKPNPLSGKIVVIPPKD
jgi:hypothetical protein